MSSGITVQVISRKAEFSKLLPTGLSVFRRYLIAKTMTMRAMSTVKKVPMPTRNRVRLSTSLAPAEACSGMKGSWKFMTVRLLRQRRVPDDAHCATSRPSRR